MKKRVLVPPALRAAKVPGKRGAPSGNRNAFKHGRFTRERRALFAEVRGHIARGRALIAAVSIPPPLHPPLEGGSKFAERISGRGRERSERLHAGRGSGSPGQAG